jgi:hypothetical protein
MMTKKELERIVAVWQKRLKLQNYRFEFLWHEDTEGQAEIKVHDDYEEATLKFGSRWREWDADRANKIVVHELLHIFENGTGVVAESLEDILESHAYALFTSRYNHECENWIDRLAFILVELGGNA